jgi:tungstate transport system ATP-binding protein
VIIIETVNVTQVREKRAILKSLSLRVERGEIFALIGPSGSGKSTLLRILDLLDTPASGRIYFDGSDVTSGRGRFLARRRMAMVLQKPVVFSTSVYDNIACGLRWRGEPKDRIRGKVNSLLEILKFTDLKNRQARTLSGGEAQRVAIARAVAIEPEVLLLDEPTANLDPVSTSQIEGMLGEIQRHFQMTMIMATHDMAQGQRLAQRIGVLVDGALMQTGDPRDIFFRPGSRAVAEFVGVENILNGKVTANEEGIAMIEVDGGTIIEAVSSFTPGQKVSVLIRPEDVTLSLEPPRGSARNHLTSAVTSIVTFGPLARVSLSCSACGFPLVALVTRRSAEEMALAKDTTVCSSFKATTIHVIQLTE